jgi:CTP synthase
MPVIAALECPLVEKSGAILLSTGSIVRQAYGQDRIEECYHCGYSVNPAYAEALFANGDLQRTAHDLEGAVRAVELRGHPFFAATLFQSERRALRGELPPLVNAFVSTARTRKAAAA